MPKSALPVGEQLMNIKCHDQDRHQDNTQVISYLLEFKRLRKLSDQQQKVHIKIDPEQYHKHGNDVLEVGGIG